MISKTHHSVVDGVSGIDIATALFDLDREPAARAPRRVAWVAQPEPSPAELAAVAVSGQRARGRDAARQGAARRSPTARACAASARR